jgi:hypothetical protein
MKDLNVRFERLAQSNFLLGRDQSIARMRDWMHECTSSHKICSQESTVQHNETRPTRLLDLNSMQRDGEFGIRLIETETGSPYQYACLSHRWDVAVKGCQTTIDNSLEMLDFIDCNQLPMNFCEAIAITRCLDIRYLWIDSLCIVQDREEDLLGELAKMGSIYQNAHLTIAAVSSPNSSDGCFMGDRWPDTCLMIEHTTNGASLVGARVLDKRGQPQSTGDFRNHYPLLTRGWVFQERLLSKRMLLCNYGELAFECVQSSCCECGSKIAPHVGGKNGAAAIRSMLFTRQRRLLIHTPTQNDASRRKTILDYWRTIVETYMQLELSYADDVLPAIAGCAQLLAVNLKLTYVAGLWKEQLSTDLLWYVKPLRLGPYDMRPTDTTAPSWSWASVAMRQSIVYGVVSRKQGWLKSNVLLRDAIQEVYYEPESKLNPFGKVNPAYLKLDATLYPWYIRSLCRRKRRDHYRAIDLHVRRSHGRSHGRKTCTPQVPELELGNAIIETRLDVRVLQEQLVKETFSYCEGEYCAPEYRCALAQIYLLPAVHRENLPRALDIFLVLKQVPPIGDRPNCYRRIGLMQVLNEEAGVGCMWDDMIQGYIEPRREVFWIF